MVRLWREGSVMYRKISAEETKLCGSRLRNSPRSKLWRERWVNVGETTASTDLYSRPKKVQSTRFGAARKISTHPAASGEEVARRDDPVQSSVAWMVNDLRAINGKV